MSGVTNQLNNNNHVINDYDLSKLFLWEPRFSKGTFKNNTGALATFEPGTVLGRDNTDNSLVPLNLANALNGEDVPVGILAEQLVDVAIAGTVANVNFATKGDVAEEKVVFVAGDLKTDATSNGATIEDNLTNRDIRLIASVDLTGPDNS